MYINTTRARYSDLVVVLLVLFLTLAITFIVFTVSVAHADIDSLRIKFGGGCIPGSTGSCTIRVTASGSELEGESGFLQRAATRRGRFSNVSNRSRSLDESGRLSMRFRNRPGCYRFVASGVRSNVICEGSGSSSGSVSSASSSASSGSASSSSSDDDDSSSRGSSSSRTSGSSWTDDDD